MDDTEAEDALSPLERAIHFLVYLVVRAALTVAQAITIESCHRGARLLGWLFSDLLKVRRKVIDENLAHAFPDWTVGQRRTLARAMWEHLFLFVAEAAQAPRKINELNWRRHLELGEGTVTQTRLLLDDRPFLMVTGHFGNFELCSHVFGMFGYRMTVIARPLDNPYLNEYVHRGRTIQGQKVLSKQGDYPKIRDILADGGTVSFVADQYAGSKGCFVDFFGRKASAHKAIALFALEHDAPVAVGACIRAGGPLKFRMFLEDLADPRDANEDVSGMRQLTQWYTSALERAIRRAPDQYWWLHRRWKDNRAARKTAKAAA